ncbi:MAG: VWA domain-containing protein [Nitrospirota bacterium]
MPPTNALILIQEFLSQTRPESEVAAILKLYESLTPLAQKEAANAGLILSDVSKKAANEYFQVAPRVLKSIEPSEIFGWVGMGMIIAESVSAAGIRYFKEGPELLSKISNRESRDAFIQLGITLSRQNPNLAMEYYRAAPILFSEMSISKEALSEWGHLGFTLGDYTLAVEYFRIAPTLLKALSIPMLPYWVGIAETLSDGRLYDAITFIRTSPEVLSGMKANALPFLTFLGILSDHDPKVATTCFQKTVEILSAIPAALKEPFLTKLLTIVRYDAEAGSALFLHVPIALKETGDAFFIPWIEQGIELLKRGEGNRYFTFESKVAKETAQQLKGGLFLSSCVKVLQHFAEGLCDRPVQIKSTDGSPTTDGAIIYLPSHIRFFEENEQNFEWYKIATAFQVGFLEFNTFWPNAKEVVRLIKLLEDKYQREANANTLSSYLSLFPKPDLISQLFDIAEAARIEFLLKREYPGLVTGITKMRQAAPSPRVLTAEASLQETIIEGLFEVSVGGQAKVPIPNEISSIFFNACMFLGAVQSREATVIHSMKAAASVYHLLDPSTIDPEVTGELERLDQKGEKVRGRGEMSGSAGGQSELKLDSTISRRSDFVHGVIDPKRVEAQSSQAALLKEQENNAAQKINVAAGGSDSSLASKGAQKAGVAPLAADGNASQRSDDLSKGIFFYDEWDCEVDDYQRRFCRVHEEKIAFASEKDVAFSEGVMSEYKGAIQSLKRAFQYFAPNDPIWIKGESEGELFDLNRLVENRVEAKGNRVPSDRVYMRRERKERSIAAAFLLDMSGSTERRLKNGKSILQMEKEALVLLSHAIDAVGDRFALYGFSGKGKDQVTVSLLKNFQTRYTKEIDAHIGSTVSLGQNRDGAAIRHVAARLSCEIAKTKILVFISDGKPQDDHYAGSYAIADTKKALFEAKKASIHPFCIVIDPSERNDGTVPEHLKAVYGNVPYLIVDKIETLPAKLPKIYRRLTT